MAENSTEGKTADGQPEESAPPQEPLPADIAEALADAIIEASVDGDDLVLTVQPMAIADVCRYLRDRDAGPYAYLASLAGVDYGDDLGVTYHIYQVGKPSRAVIHARLDREVAVLPSVADVFPAANWKEREAQELFGITFEGHPDPRKLLLPEDWEGHPLRKDYVCPDHPFLRPDPLHELEREKGTPTELGAPDRRSAAQNRAMATTEFKTEDLVINMGPQHPSTHGVLRLVVTLDGELVVDCVPHIGYLHSSLEKICENRTYVQIVPFTDRFDYLASLANNFTYVLAVERLVGVEVPRRAGYIRVLMAELQRIASHLVWLGTYGLDLGAITVFLYCFREREVILDLLESVTGQRLLYNYMRIGGLRNDLPPGFSGGLRDFLSYFPGRIDEYDQLFTNNRIFRARTTGVGILSGEDTIAYAVSGPMARGSGLDMDLRRNDPYSVYPELEFDVPVLSEADCLARYLVRVEEMRQSVRIALQCLDALDGMQGEPTSAKVPKTIRPPEGEVYVRTESPRGELGCYVISDGSPQPLRMHWRAPSFANLQVLPLMVRGGLVADIMAVLGSIDIVLGDVDR